MVGKPLDNKNVYINISALITKLQQVQLRMSVLLQDLVEFFDRFGHVLGRLLFELQIGLLLLVEGGTADLSLLLQLGDDALVLPTDLVRQASD